MLPRVYTLVCTLHSRAVTPHKTTSTLVSRTPSVFFMLFSDDFTLSPHSFTNRWRHSQITRRSVFFNLFLGVIHVLISPSKFEANRTVFLLQQNSCRADETRITGHERVSPDNNRVFLGLVSLLLFLEKMCEGDLERSDASLLTRIVFGMG